MDSFIPCNLQLLLKHFPCCCPTVLFPTGSSEDIFWTAMASTGLVGNRCHSGAVMSLLATLTSLTLTSGWKIKNLTLVGADGLDISKERYGGEHFPQLYLQPFSHTTSSLAFSAHICNFWLLNGRSERLQRCLLREDASAVQTLSGQESPQYCCQSKQEPRIYLSPSISQAGVKKSWKGKKGPGGKHPWMAVTFAGLISQDQNPLSCCRVPSHSWLLPGNPKWLDGWDGCQPHCWKTSQHQLTHPLLASIHLLSPVFCLESQHLEAVGSVCPPSVQNPAVGLSGPAAVTDSFPESGQPTPRCSHATCSRRVHLVQRGVLTALHLHPDYTASCGFYWTLRRDTDSSHVPPKNCLTTPSKKRHPHRSGDSSACSGVFRLGLQLDLKDEN